MFSSTIIRVFLQEQKRHYSMSKHSHKKRKDSLETWAALLIFSIELEISGVALPRIHQNRKKMLVLVRNCSVKTI